MKIQLSNSIGHQSIDRELGVIHGVSVITAGRASGHWFSIDKTTLEQVADRGAEFSDGVRVKIDHGTGFDAIVGTLKSFRVEGDHVRADLHLVKAHPKYAAILEMAENMPGTFGLSIAFSGKSEDVSGTKCARCQELYSVDLVDTPAANPTGLFSARVDSATTVEDMEATQNTGFVEALREFFGGKNPVEELSAKLSATETNLTAAQTEITTLKAAVAQKESDLATVKQSLASVSAERDTLKATLANPDGEVAKLAAQKAQEIAAAQGVPAPIALKAETRPGAQEPKTWTEKCQAAKAA